MEDFSVWRPGRTVCWNFFTGWITTPIWGQGEAAWPPTGDGFCRAIHNIENAPFRTKFERDVEEMKGNLGIGCISDYEPQPLLIQSHLGSFAIATVGKINNLDAILEKAYNEGHSISRR